MKDQDTLYWLWLAEKCGIASKHFDKLIEKYDDPFDIYRLEEAEIEQFPNLSTGLRSRLCEKNLDASYEILKYCNQNGVDIISYGDKRYPQRLKNIEDPPVVLYCKGFFPDLNSALCIGVVGTRKMSEYGRQSTYKISYELARAGAVTISGMALGIDGVSECGALAAGGKTVAVLGCGIDTVYPKQHARLMNAITKHGAVITEYPPMEEPRGYNFPKRNRIISGLSHGVFVVEAAPESGALITAQNAIAQGRDVFALPGKISDVNSIGTNELIKNGCYPALSATDILRKYEFLYGDRLKMSALKDFKKNVPDIDKVLAEYGLDYAVNNGTSKEKEERPFVAGAGEKKGLGKTEKKKSITKKATSENTKEKNKDNARNDSDMALVEGLDASTRRVYDSIPDDRAISIDGISAIGIDTPELMTALTMLELQGLIMSLPGGLYKRR